MVPLPTPEPADTGMLTAAVAAPVEEELRQPALANATCEAVGCRVVRSMAIL